MQPPRVSTIVFGTIAGEQVVHYDLQCASLRASFVNYGATLLSLQAPDRQGALGEVVLSFPSLQELATGTSYYGATVGRVANRIARGRFSLDGREYELPQNNGPNTLHGGLQGFDRKLWRHSPVEEQGRAGVRFSYESEHGEEGFPGCVSAVATYCLTSENALTTEFEAVLAGGDADATIVNLCNHAYWNLSGDLKEDVGDHELQLHCSKYLPVDSVQIPTGELAAVGGTPFDFLRPTRLGDVMPLVDGGGKPGLDHCFVIDGAAADSVEGTIERPMAVLSHAASGRRVALHGTQPGVQVYTNNWGSEAAEDAPHCQHWAVCLETQAFPNAANVPAWAPQVVLRRGARYHHTSRHVFSTF